MLDQLAAAIDRQDYNAAAKLLKSLQAQSPDSPWVAFYRGRLQEAAGRLDMAATIYRQLLQNTTNPKVINQVRQGLQRLETIAQTQRQQAIAQAKRDPAQAGLGFLVLEALAQEAKQAAAQQFARIMQLDAYTARLQLPSRGWRLYRVGTVGELQFYGQELQQAGIPVFWGTLAAIEAIRVFQVHYLQTIAPSVTVVCHDEAGRLGSLTFDWSEVSDRVEGLLPIFEEVVDVDANHQLQRKEQTQDYTKIVDLHLPKRHCLLRFCDRHYQFQQGILFDAAPTQAAPIATTRMRWNRLTDLLSDRLSQTRTWSEFTPFAETALEHLDTLKNFKAHIEILRKAPTSWDSAFHLYSGLVFERLTRSVN